ncbi:MAG TPA: InlB B-repeat-containing protein [Candidatus Scatosoma pullistercoris]|uniref:InlB B-repeat-containing protein n=1 Tax=Candidatus Scatosoma pullistercoris TaxID=2840934 RepID=A0A9D1MFS3_9FIRM|nr:InlB B-repeat-containing protein [Candidatus Scatosoma pullistercoris]
MKNPVRRTWLVIVSVLLLVLLSLGAVACGAKSYTLTFVTNGGTEIAPITAEAGAAIEPPADPEKDGWVFDGWFTASDFSGEETEIPSVMPEKNITYYAKFTEIPKAMLTLDAGVGTLETAVYEMEIGADVSGFVADIVPVTPEGVTFAGWFEGDAPLGEDVTMPAAGIRLTARYTAAYTVEIYLQSAPESEEYTLDADAETEGGSGYLGDAVDLSSSLKAPTGYKLNKTRTQPLVLGTEGNVFKAYYDLSVYTVYYFDNAPQDATVEGEMANGSAYYSYETEIPANGYSIEGYRFAGWATSPRGGVVYQSGDKITASSTLMLYACWNLGITDANGGKDVLYVLKEEPGTIVLERQYAEDRKGIYDEATRTFYFGKGANDNSLPRGRVAADGASFVYYYEAFALTFSRYDWMAEELVAAETIVLDGVDGAVYTYTENGEKKTAEGTYMPEGTSYSFVSDDGAVEFVFALGTLTYGEGEDAEQTDVFLVRDDCAGTYYYMNGSGSIYYFPLIILDGYGEVIYMESISGDGILSGSYVPAGGENTVEVTIETSEGAQNAMYRLTREVPTQSGTAMNVFENADGMQGVYSFRMTGGDGEGTMKVEADGFGELHYTFTPDSGTAVNGDAAYYYLGTYTSGETGYGIFYFTVGTGESAHRYTVRFETEGTGVQLIGSEAGVYSELNPDSPYTARLFLHGDGTAQLSFFEGDELKEYTASAAADPSKTFGEEGYTVALSGLKGADGSSVSGSGKAVFSGFTDGNYARVDLTVGSSVYMIMNVRADMQWDVSGYNNLASEVKVKMPAYSSNPLVDSWRYAKLSSAVSAGSVIVYSVADKAYFREYDAQGRVVAFGTAQVGENSVTLVGETKVTYGEDGTPAYAEDTASRTAEVCDGRGSLSLDGKTYTYYNSREDLTLVYYKTSLMGGKTYYYTVKTDGYGNMYVLDESSAYTQAYLGTYVPEGNITVNGIEYTVLHFTGNMVDNYGRPESSETVELWILYIDVLLQERSDDGSEAHWWSDLAGIYTAKSEDTVYTVFDDFGYKLYEITVDSYGSIGYVRYEYTLKIDGTAEYTPVAEDGIVFTPVLDENENVAYFVAVGEDGVALFSVRTNGAENGFSVVQDGGLLVGSDIPARFTVDTEAMEQLPAGISFGDIA